MSTATLLSIQVGPIKTYGTPDAPDPMDQQWTTAIFKFPIPGPVWLSETNLAGDGQADRRFHGGLDKAVLGYSAEHYPVWRTELSKPDLPYGGFGENFTISGQSEETVCIGDIYDIGEARVQVSQPRQPCYKLARRWRFHKLTARVKETGWGGWYFRVLAEGHVDRGHEVKLIERPHSEWSVLRAFQTMQRRKEDRAAAEALAEINELSADFRDGLFAGS